MTSLFRLVPVALILTLSGNSFGQLIIRGGPTGIVRSTTENQPTAPVGELLRPRSTPYYSAQDIRLIQRYYALQKSLGIIATTAQEEMVFPVNDLFPRDQSQLHGSGRSLLDDIAAYLAMNGAEGIKVAYHFNSGNDNPDQARTRSLSILKYLSLKTGRPPGWFTLGKPEPLDPDSRLSNGESLVSIALERPVEIRTGVRQ